MAGGGPQFFFSVQGERQNFLGALFKNLVNNDTSLAAKLLLLVLVKRFIVWFGS